MQMPSCVSVLTVTDTYLGSLYIAPRFSCFCWRRWIAPIKGVCQNLWAETTSCSTGSRGIKTMLVLCDHIKCLQSLSFNNRGCDWDCHSLYVYVSLCGVFPFSCLLPPGGKWGLRLKQRWWTWDAAGTSTCSSHRFYPEGQDLETSLTQSAGSILCVSTSESPQKSF